MENQGEGCRRPLRPFLASHLFRLLPPPSTPSPAAHNFAPLVPALRERDGRPPRPVLDDAISTTSPLPRHQSTSKQRLQGSASGYRSSCPPRPLPRLSSTPSGGDGRADHQPGRATPSRSPCRPSPPCCGRPTAPRLTLQEVLSAYSTDPDEMTLSQAT